MIKKRLSVIAVTALLLSSSLPAQQQPGGPALGTAISRIGQRIVEECEVESACRPAPMPIMRTVRLPIPAFSPLDAETHVYAVSHVREHGSGGGSAFPDDDGFLIKEDAVGLITDNPTGPADEERQYYFTSMHVSTLQPLTTLDLHQVQLRTFLNSLQSAIWMATNFATRSDMRLRRPPRSNMGIFRDVRVSIRGEHLTLDEVLDAIYLNTGCVVNQEAEVLVVASCP